ncbi:stemmadenine O-acetyltransferase-like [Cannabis sativa]|uniref:stemmadenine O-acetyltransferase-like n=1 Tax=Cannabis sativa TaxID=3483 RepID=UPI0029C9BFF5|nr:stemmadenine O-acetyltransferase-like [Cannabis sativa]
MNIEVEAISNEIIKPSYPTPKNLERYKLSLLDQSSPKFYNPLVFYYTKKNTTTIINPAIILKRSLSAILTHYYPLAGRLEKHGQFIHCNDEGVPFVETQVNGRLSHVMSNPIAQELDIFCPLISRHDESDDAHQILFAAQLNMFECGGIAVGISFSDKIADALSWMKFVKTWALMARGGTTTMLPKSLHPEFVSSILFPPRPQSMIEAKTCVMKKGIITKIFVFNGFAIEALRAMYSDKENNIRPSRVETLSTFIISRFEAALSAATATEVAKLKKERVYTILHTVNLHPRMNPPLAENSFGNFLVFAGTHIPASSINGEASITNGIVKKIREAIKKVNKEYLDKLQKGEEDEQLSMIEQSSKNIEKSGGEVIEFQVTSLSRFHFYEMDFGWGKPDWNSTAAWNFDKIIAFFDTNDGDGIEAYVSLKEEDMAKFEADKQLRKFVTPNYYSRNNINSNL